MPIGYRWLACDLILDLHVQPGARASELAEAHGEALRLRVAAPPADGRANRELVRYLAALFGVPKRHVVLEHGLTGRRKKVRIVAPTTLPPGICRG